MRTLEACAALTAVSTPCCRRAPDAPGGVCHTGTDAVRWHGDCRGGRLAHPEIMQVVEACQPPAGRPLVVPQQQQQQQTPSNVHPTIVLAPYQQQHPQQQQQQQQQIPFNMHPTILLAPYQQPTRPAAAGQQHQQHAQHPGHGASGPAAEQFMQPTPRVRGQQRAFPAMMSA